MRTGIYGGCWKKQPRTIEISVRRAPSLQYDFALQAPAPGCLLHCTRHRGSRREGCHFAIFFAGCAKRSQKTLVFPMILKKRDPFRPHFGTFFTTFGMFEDVKDHFWDVSIMVYLVDPSTMACVMRRKQVRCPPSRTGFVLISSIFKERIRMKPEPPGFYSIATTKSTQLCIFIFN